MQGIRRLQAKAGTQRSGLHKDIIGHGQQRKLAKTFLVLALQSHISRAPGRNQAFQNISVGLLACNTKRLTISK